MNPTIPEVLNSPCTSYWLKRAIKENLDRDICDAAHDAALLAKLLADERARMLKADA